MCFSYLSQRGRSKLSMPQNGTISAKNYHAKEPTGTHKVDDSLMFSNLKLFEVINFRKIK
jgi:hypothetical protein